MSDENQARQLGVFTLGAEQYALPIEQVHEIIRYDEPRSVASPIAWVRGVISLRGRIVPVYDLAARLGLDSELSDSTKIVIVEAGSETAGVTGGETGKGANGSGEACANTGAAQTMAPNASNPDLKNHPPSEATSPSMPRTCLRVD